MKLLIEVLFKYSLSTFCWLQLVILAVFKL
nr:MAG TPA: hypothetical protein [Caudoviricetes sp.]